MLSEEDTPLNVPKREKKTYWVRSYKWIDPDRIYRNIVPSHKTDFYSIGFLCQDVQSLFRAKDKILEVVGNMFKMGNFIGAKDMLTMSR